MERASKVQNRRARRRRLVLRLVDVCSRLTAPRAASRANAHGSNARLKRFRARATPPRSRAIAGDAPSDDLSRRAGRNTLWTMTKETSAHNAERAPLVVKTTARDAVDVEIADRARHAGGEGEATPTARGKWSNAGRAALAVACATEETFTLLGLSLMIIGEGAEAMRMVLFQHFMGNRGFGLLEGLFYTCPANFFFLSVGVAIFEQREITLRGDLAIVRANPWPFVAVSVLGFLVMVTTLGVIKTCGSLTFKAAGQVRNVAIIMFSVVFMGEKTTPVQLVGYAMNVLGFAYYQKYKTDEDVSKITASSDGEVEREKLLDSPRSSNGSADL